MVSIFADTHGAWPALMLGLGTHTIIPIVRPTRTCPPYVARPDSSSSRRLAVVPAEVAPVNEYAGGVVALRASKRVFGKQQAGIPSLL